MFLKQDVSDQKANALPPQFSAPILLGQDLKSLLGADNCPEIKSAAHIAASFEAMAHLEREVMIVGTVDCKCRLVYWNLLAVGSSDCVTLRIGEAFHGAIETEASSIFLVHNHPSGSLEASTADIQTTEEIAKAGLLLGYPLLDHVIISRKGFRSLLTKETLRPFKRRSKHAEYAIVECAESSVQKMLWVCSNCKYKNSSTESPHKVGTLCSLVKCQRCGCHVWCSKNSV